MPHPLARLPNASSLTLEFGPESVGTNRSLAAKLGECIASWTHVEASSAHLLATLLRADTEAILRMLDSVSNSKIRMSMLSAAATSVLNPDDLDAFNAAMRAIAVNAKQRNRLVHWQWGYSPDLPDTLLLIDPAELRDHTFNIGEPRVESSDWPRRMDLSLVFVYDYREFDRLIRDFRELNSIIGNLRFLLNPQTRRSFGRDNLMNTLQEIKQFRDAWIYIRSKS